MDTSSSAEQADKGVERMDTKRTVGMEIDDNSNDGSCSTEGGSAPQRESLGRGIRRMSGTIDQLAGSLKEAARLAQFQPARPAQGISPPSLLDQSRKMRRALNMSCHGDDSDPTDEFLDNGGGLASQFNFTDDDDDGDGNGDNDAWKLGDPLHESTRLGSIRNEVGRLVNLGPIQWALMGMIIANSLILGALTFLHDNPVATQALETVDLAFLIIFSVELVAQFFYLGIQFFKNGWLMFDAVIVSVSWAFEDSEFTVMRSFRIFRLFAMVSRWTSLQRLFKAIGKTIPKMGTIAAMLGLFFYAFSVFYTNLFWDLYDEGYLDVDYFGNLQLTFLTLFQVMTMDSWTAMVRQVMEVYPWAWVGFVIWVIVTAFFFVNLIVAVICESLIEINSHRDMKRHGKMLRHQDNVVRDQTKTLIAETQQLLKIQNEMLANQIIMERTLLQVVDLLKETGGGSIGSVSNLKEPLRSVLSSIEQPNSSSAFFDSGLTDASGSNCSRGNGD